MAPRAPHREDRRPPLSRERVLQAAMQLADKDGIERVTMRRLAQELGVEAMSLYHHVARKEDILNGLAEMVVSEFELPQAGDDWKPAIRRTAVSAYGTLLAHRWAPALLLAGSTDSRARLRYMDAVLGTFRRGGFSAEMTDHAYHALDSHIMGFALWVAGMNLGTDEELAVLARDFLRSLPRDEMPYLAEHIEQHMKPRPPGDEGEFQFGLDLILDGLERHLSAG